MQTHTTPTKIITPITDPITIPAIAPPDNPSFIFSTTSLLGSSLSGA